jgi:hypothetical protein
MEMVMKVRWAGWLTFGIALIFVGAAAFAHGNKVHVKGKIEKIGPDSLQVRTADGKSVEVKLAASTVYIQHMPPKPGEPADSNEDKPAKLTDLVVGDSVVIHATPKDGSLEADEVKFSAPGSGKMASAAPKPKA